MGPDKHSFLILEEVFIFGGFVGIYFWFWGFFFKIVRSLQLFLIPCPVNDRSLSAINDTRYLLTDLPIIVPRQRPEHFLADTRGARGWLSAARAPGGPGGE